MRGKGRGAGRRRSAVICPRGGFRHSAAGDTTSMESPWAGPGREAREGKPGKGSPPLCLHTSSFVAFGCARSGSRRPELLFGVGTHTLAHTYTHTYAHKHSRTPAGRQSPGKRLVISTALLTRDARLSNVGQLEQFIQKSFSF